MSFREKTRRIMTIFFILVFTAALTFTSRTGSGQATEEETVFKTKAPLYYTVQKGDCLWSIAEKLNVEIDLLAFANKMDTEDVLQEDTELVIPEDNKITYTVGQGDTLWGLAKKFNTTVASLVSENGTAILETLMTEQEIVIPVQGPIEETNRQETSPVMGGSIPELDSWPVMGTLSSGFGKRWGRMHKGIDIAADTGEPIRAVQGGIVVFAGNRGTYGKTVIINHGDGFRSLYAHTSKLKVSSGERVEEGQVIALVGSSGRSTGPHLHLELLYQGQPVNPEKYLPDKM